MIVDASTIQTITLLLNILIIPMLWVLIGIKSELAELRRWLKGHENDIRELKQDMRMMRGGA